uniref:probable ATP-dependent RNA helicase DDX52 n=1 Tax=Styela clava TaxID=7725 RepID=UPI00193A2DB4|nr:probable ATP-dependent RNA helicase DDX52 [Styela clava]XP_039262074.1 probable ATP-dependent RNA helicase DDX52 [Styela clava]XP_039262075.1 probable ATP-dependent RNA helicase DDX52 [Styela clava]
MDDQDVLRELCFGLKFDFKRFPEDAKKLKLVKSEKIDNTNTAKDYAPHLNFFKNKTSDPNKKTTNGRGIETYSNKLGDTHEENNFRKLHKIFIEGTDVPDLLENFQQLISVFNLNQDMLEAIEQNMKFSIPTPIQMQAITAMLHRREVLACAPTGSGKTLAFLIPLIAHIMGKSVGDCNTRVKKGKRTLKGLVVSPTRELATQTLNVCKQLITPISSNVDQLMKVQILDKATMKKFQTAGAKHRDKYDILISTPNRLVHLLTHDPPLISLESIEWLIVDESDKLFEEGNTSGFREQLGTIYSACTSPRIRRAMFSATFAFDVQQWCHLNMDSVIQITVGGKNTAVKSVDQRLLFTGNERGKLIALRDLFRQGFKPPVLIFVQSKERAKQLFAELIYDGMNVDAIHADRTQLQRENAVKALRSGSTWILICTELLGRGIDFKGVNLVVNYDFPTSAISYIHRIGRTGRAGRKGEAVTFFTENDKILLRSIANVIKEAGCPIPEYMLKMKKMAKDERKKMAKTKITRDTIRTTPKDILNRKRKNKDSKTETDNKDTPQGKGPKTKKLRKSSIQHKSKENPKKL